MRLLQPATVDDVLDLLVRHRGLAQLVGGGCHLIRVWRASRDYPSVAIDLSRVEALNFAYVADDELHLGPASSLSALLEFSPLIGHAPLLAACLRRIGTPQVRNRATLAGCLLASHSSEALVALAALGARMTVRRKSAHRAIAIDAYAHSPARHALRPDELVTDITVPPQQEGRAWFYQRFPQTTVLANPDLSLACCSRQSPTGMLQFSVFFALPRIGAIGMETAAAELAGGRIAADTISSAVQAARKQARAAIGGNPADRRWADAAADIFGRELYALMPALQSAASSQSSP